MENSGRKEARDVVLSFTNMLPLGTKVWTDDPAAAVTLEEAEMPPDPSLITTLTASAKETRGGERYARTEPPESAAAKLKVAFIVKIPRVAAGDALVLHVATTHPDNERAAKQVLRIREHITAVIRDFSQAVAAAHPDAATDTNVAAVLSARLKEESFFTLGRLSYEAGRFPVSFLTEEEEIAKAVNQDLLTRYKAEFIEVFRGRPEFLAPVIRIRTNAGESTYAIMPPHIKTCVLYRLAWPIPAQSIMELPPPVPDSYEDNPFCS